MNREFRDHGNIGHARYRTRITGGESMGTSLYYIDLHFTFLAYYMHFNNKWWG
jgi:hypothetical protein